MALDLTDCQFTGPALPEPFVKFELENELTKLKLLAKSKDLKEDWEAYPKAPELCLARFDELKSIGLEKFTRKYDPYWDIPLNENLPQPVIDLPIPGEAKEDGGEYRLTNKPKGARGRKRK